MDSVWRRSWPTLAQLISTALAVAGLILVTQPSFIFGDADTELDGKFSSELTGHGMALASGFFYSIGTMMISIFGTVHWSLWVLSQGLQTILLSGILIALSTAGVVGAALTVVTPVVAAVVALICIFDVTGRVSVVIACQEHTPSLVVLVGVAQIPMTYAWSAIWLGEILGQVKTFGVLSICLAIGLVLFVNTRTSRGEEEEEQEDEEMSKILSEKNFSNEVDRVAGR